MRNNIIVMNQQMQIIENKLFRMQELDHQIKVLEAELSMLKKEVINDYFIYSKQEEYRTSKGLLLATYKSYTENRFNSKRFEMDHPDYYSMYKEQKIIFKFLLK